MYKNKIIHITIFGIFAINKFLELSPKDFMFLGYDGR